MCQNKQIKEIIFFKQDMTLLYPIHRRSYKSAHVLLNLFKQVEERDKIRGLPSILSLFRNDFNKINNTGA